MTGEKCKLCEVCHNGYFSTISKIGEWKILGSHHSWNSEIFILMCKNNTLLASIMSYGDDWSFLILSDTGSLEITMQFDSKCACYRQLVNTITGLKYAPGGTSMDVKDVNRVFYQSWHMIGLRRTHGEYVSPKQPSRLYRLCKKVGVL